MSILRFKSYLIIVNFWMYFFITNYKTYLILKGKLCGCITVSTSFEVTKYDAYFIYHSLILTWLFVCYTIITYI